MFFEKPILNHCFFQIQTQDPIWHKLSSSLATWVDDLQEQRKRKSSDHETQQVLITSSCFTEFEPKSDQVACQQVTGAMVHRPWQIGSWWEKCRFMPQNLLFKMGSVLMWNMLVKMLLNLHHLATSKNCCCLFQAEKPRLECKSEAELGRVAILG